MKSKIVIYGAGMAGAILASRLAEDFDVTVVAPTNYFEVPMAMPRLMVQPGLADKAIISIADALPKVHHVHGHLAELIGIARRVPPFGLWVRPSQQAKRPAWPPRVMHAAGILKPQKFARFSAARVLSWIRQICPLRSR